MKEKVLNNKLKKRVNSDRSQLSQISENKKKIINDYRGNNYTFQINILNLHSDTSATSIYGQKIVIKLDLAWPLVPNYIIVFIIYKVFH
ncbi:MAG: hypothetical protein ACTSU2_12325 [Promethearchaeota archaeon]